MKKTWENDSCEAVQSYFTVYRVPVAAALWCGIEPGEVEEHLALSTEVARGVFPCFFHICLFSFMCLWWRYGYVGLLSSAGFAGSMSLAPIAMARVCSSLNMPS